MSEKNEQLKENAQSQNLINPKKTRRNNQIMEKKIRNYYFSYFTYAKLK